MRWMAILLPLMAAACGRLSSDLQWAQGKTDAEVMTKWGAPSRESEAGGSRIMTWNRYNAVGEYQCSQTAVSRGGRVVGTSHTC